MAAIRLINGKIIGDFKKPYIVAEFNTSHNGNIDTAKEMIIKAKESGCDCVKFQSWTQDSLYSKTYYKDNPIAKRFVTKFSLSEDQLLELSLYCKEQEIDFASTPYSKKEVDFLLEKCDVPYIKVASMDLNNYSFLEYIAKTGSPIVLATGMGSLEEIWEATKVIEEAGNDKICLLHCISIYPPEISTIRLNNIVGLRKCNHEYPVGFSDHSLGIEMASAATALGSAMIEKHFTLDKTRIGMDNQMAIEPDEMKQLVNNCNNIQLALGSNVRIVFEAEREQKQKMRRSIVSTRDLKIGDVLKEEYLDVKRPGIGIPPEKIKDLIGKTVINDIEADTLIFEKDLK